MSRSEFLAMQDELLRDLGVLEPVVIMLNNGTGFDNHLTRAVVRGYKESELLPGGTIQQGDVKVMISDSDYPALVNRPLERKDRIQINGKSYSVIHFDENTRSIGPGDPIMYEITVRG